MQDYYKLLSVETSASAAEIRRAYRVLARRYHPDLNPGAQSGDVFKEISTAYKVLIDPTKRKSYDVELRASQRSHVNKQASSASFQKKRYEHAERARNDNRNTKNRFSSESTRQSTKKHTSNDNTDRSASRSTEKMQDKQPLLLRTLTSFKNLFSQGGGQPSAVSVVEISVSIREAVLGAKKVVEIEDSHHKRRVSVKIPPGVRTGSVIHLKSKKGQGEDLVVIVRIAPHAYLSMHIKGLVVEVPVTIKEAIQGARIRVPTLEEPALVSIPPGSQSGHEIRLRNRGPLQRDGSRGDIFYRLLIRVPEQPFAPGLSEKVHQVTAYYEETVRKQLPDRIFP
jgi:DnaJ-class molecular chaperone